MAEKIDIEMDLTRIRARLADLDAERCVLQREMKALEARLVAETAPTVKQPSFENIPVTNSSPSHEKVNLFRSLFAGRPDVFPVRLENRKTGHSGYSPACANEWVRGICGKPKVKCGECPHQKFIPPDEGVMEEHLLGGDGRSGDFVAGVQSHGSQCGPLPPHHATKSNCLNAQRVNSLPVASGSDRESGNPLPYACVRAVRNHIRPYSAPQMFYEITREL